ncbi:MAG: glycosyltransferase family 39 protein [Chloroflexota bacterium]|nr:glycosyltransferase family 39 protein [Chloroflexota bacterium]
MLAVHTAGVTTVVRLTRQPLWFGALCLLVVLPAGNSWRRKRLVLLPETLTPLVIPYAIGILRLAVAAIAGRSDPQAAPVPEPWATLLDLNVAMLLALAWVLLAQLDAAARAFGHSIPWQQTLGTIILGLTLGWAALAYTSTRTHGVTASDPSAYVQMAVDLAAHGTPLHSFPLTPLAERLDLPLWPLVPVGYAPPDPDTHLSASAWPPGYSALLSIVYRADGETAVYWVTPLLGVGALLGMWALTLELLRSEPAWRRRLSAGLAVLVLATSFEQVDHVLVPMADIPAQLFTILAVLFALRGSRTHPEWYGGLSGVCLGIAFDMRYTQVLLAASLLLVWARRGPSAGGRAPQLRGLVWSAIAAWAVVLPLFWYHAIVFGSPLSVESSELQLFAVGNILDNLVGILGDFLRPNEFLLLVPFGILGAARLWWTQRWTSMILATWLIVLVGFHLPYAALRIRDLLSVFPVLALVVGVGMLAAISWVDRAKRGARLAVVGLIIGVLWVRGVGTLEGTGPGAQYSGFGYLLPQQRAAFDTLADATSVDAIVGSTLNGGPIMLYSGRTAVRPGAWARGDWLRFVGHVLDSHGRLFMLDDGDELSRPLADLRGQYQLELRSSLFLPYFSTDAGSVNRGVPLYEVVRLSD